MPAVEEATLEDVNSCGMVEPPAGEFYVVMIYRMARRTNARTIMSRCNDKDMGLIFSDYLALIALYSALLYFS